MSNETQMVRKHAFNVLSKIGERKHTEYRTHDKTWDDLTSAKNFISKEIKRLGEDASSNGATETYAQELEAAIDGLFDLRHDIQKELDLRTRSGSTEPRSDYKYALSQNPDFRAPGDYTVISRSPEKQEFDVEPRSDKPFALRSDQSLRAWAQPNSDRYYNNLSLGRYFGAMVRGASSELEQRALTEGTDSAGGYTVPEVLANQLIDNTRANSVVSQAGAQTVPLTSDHLSIARLASDPVPAFRNEVGSVAESDPTFDTVTLAPRSMAVMTKISRELFEDSVNLESELPRILSVAMAKEMDRICLLGSGTAPEPRGVANQSGIGTTAKDAALTTYGDLISAQTDILTNNAGPVSAIIMHPRDAGTYAGFTDSTGQPLNMPNALNGIPMLTTTAIPVDGGAGTNESTIFVGNFNHLLIGVRSAIRVEVLKERYADTLEYGLIAHMRFDVALQHAKAFHTITGVQG